MALVDARDFQLTPDILGATGQALKLTGRLKKGIETQQTRSLISQILDPKSLPEEKAEAQRQLSALNPQAAQQFQKTGDEDRGRRLKSAALLGLNLQGATTVQDKIRVIQNKIADNESKGLDSEESIEILGMFSSGDERQIATANQLVDTAVNLGVRNKLIQPTAVGATGMASAKTVINDDGSSIQALPNGQVNVRNPSGQLVTGQARLDVLQQARDQAAAKQQARADLTVQTTRRTEQVKDATETANKAFGLVDSIRKNINNLKQVTPLVNQGASTGPVTSLFPSFKAETVKLEQLQKRLSLDVVGAVKFGALSEGELDLAKAVALPLSLSGDELIQWVNDSISAKEKLATYFEDQAIFLSKGNTQSDWLKFKRDELKAIASEEDIKATMKANNMTRQEVIQEQKRRKAGGR